MRSMVARGGTARTTSSAPRTARPGVSAISVMAVAFNASTDSARDGEYPTTRATPARRACQASDPPMAPSPMTARDEGRTSQSRDEVVTRRIVPPCLANLNAPL